MKKKKILFFVPGSGGTFYCQNCCRDYALVQSLQNMGYEAVIAPLYLPLDLDDPQMKEENPIFYGALRVYLNEKLPFFHKVPLAWKSKLNSIPLLKWLARQSAKTHSSGMEEITLSLLKGEDGKQKKELDEIIRWLKVYEKPDVVYLSNALLCGIAKAIHQELGIPVFCFLQDEHQWVENMSPQYQDRVWHEIRERSSFIQKFIPVSHYYARFIQEKVRLPREKFHPIYPGINIDNFPYSFSGMPAIGYVSRWDARLGLGILLEAFYLLKEQAKFQEWKLLIMGGKSKEDEKFLLQEKKKWEGKNLSKDIEFFPLFHEKARKELYSRISLLCVPNPQGEAFGLFLLEAQASGIPVVQPDTGAYPEILQKTQGGVLYAPNDPQTLAKALSHLMEDPEKSKDLGQIGRKTVEESFSIQRMAQEIAMING